MLRNNQDTFSKNCGKVVCLCCAIIKMHFPKTVGKVKTVGLRTRNRKLAMALLAATLLLAVGLGDGSSVHRSLQGAPPAPVPAPVSTSTGTPQWTGPGSSPVARNNAKLADDHKRGSAPAPVPGGVGGATLEDCRRIQHQSWSGSWSSVSADDQAKWKSAKVRALEQLLHKRAARRVYTPCVPTAATRRRQRACGVESSVCR